MKTVCVCMMAVAVLLGCAGCGSYSAESSLGKGTTGFLHKEPVRGSRKRVYALFVPPNYDARKKYPTIVFLHGIGEGGNDAKANLRVGLGPYVYAQRDDFPFIVIFPQSESGEWKENSEAAADVIPCLDDVAKHYSVDPDRVILTGVSTGGYGTWDRGEAQGPFRGPGADGDQRRRAALCAGAGGHAHPGLLQRGRRDRGVRAL